MKKIKFRYGRTFSWLLSPLLLGVLFTSVFSWVSWQYLILAHQGNTEALKQSGAFQVFHLLHEKSIDFRLRARGYMAPSSEVAVVAIDERAVQSIGRWPWPREKIGQLINELFKFEIKALGFDAFFPEASDHPTERLISTLDAQLTLPAKTKELLQQTAEQFDSDKAMAKAIQAHANRTVLGVFYDNYEGLTSRPGHIDRCHDLIFRRDPAFFSWDKEQIFLEVHTETVDIPEAIKDLWNYLFDEIEQTVREKTSAPKNKKEEFDLLSAIQSEQKFKFCVGFLDPTRDELYPSLKENWKALLENEPGGLYPFETFDNWVENFKAKSLRVAIPSVSHWTMNTDVLSQSAIHRGFVNADLDHDGAIRRKSLMVRTGQSFFPSLALKTYLVAHDYNAKVVLQFLPQLQSLAIKEFQIVSAETGDELFRLPSDPTGSLMINYSGPQKMIPHISASELLTPGEDAFVEQRVFEENLQKWEVKKLKIKKADFFKDKILLVGATATGIYDLRVTPFEENYPGVETHANLISNFLKRDFLTKDPREEVLMPLGLFFAGSVLTFGLSYSGALTGLLLLLSSLFGLVFIDYLFFFGDGKVVSLVLPLTLVSSLYVALTFFRYLTEERGKRELKATFQKYVSPAIVNEVLASPENIELGGKKMNVSVFFSDVRGFTTISERLDPSALSDLLNSYLTPMTELIFEHKGTLDKYMGDAIMAFFGAPIAYPDHAHCACRCALAHLRQLKILQQEYQAKGLPTIDIGIGINTGEVSVGNMGSETVRSYTVMGDAVNLASRLEGINKQYGTRIIISEFTEKEVRSRFSCRVVDLVRVKGKDQPVSIYELIKEGRLEGVQNQVFEHYQKGFDLYHQRQFSEALNSFQQALKLDPDDTVVQLYIDRSQKYLDDPPPEVWDGVFVMTSK